MRFVLDNSVVCGWLFEAQATDYSHTIAQRMEHSRAIAPALLRLEYTNVLRSACLRGKLIASQAQDMLGMLERLPIDIDDAGTDTRQLLALALRYELSSYNAAYLDLALRRQLPIATQDAALADAARRAGVGVVER